MPSLLHGEINCELLKQDVNFNNCSEQDVNINNCSDKAWKGYSILTVDTIFCIIVLKKEAAHNKTQTIMH